MNISSHRCCCCCHLPIAGAIRNDYTQFTIDGNQFYVLEIFLLFFLFIRTCTCITKTMPASSSNNNERRPHPRNPACPRLICLVFIFPHVGCVRKLLSLAINLASPRTYRTTEKVSFFIVNDYNNNDGKSYYAPAPGSTSRAFIHIHNFQPRVSESCVEVKKLKNAHDQRTRYELEGCGVWIPQAWYGAEEIEITRQDTLRGANLVNVLNWYLLCDINRSANINAITTKLPVFNGGCSKQCVCV